MSGLSHISINVRTGLMRIRVPVTLKRRFGRKLIVVPGQNNGDGQPPDSSGTLALAVARAHDWQRLLEEGRFRTVSELARKLGVDEAKVRRTLRLTLLAPDIIEAILQGYEPDGLSLEDLVRAPVRWDEQRNLIKSEGAQ